jgi:hypothetical protein
MRNKKTPPFLAANRNYFRFDLSCFASKPKNTSGEPHRINPTKLLRTQSDIWENVCCCALLCVNIAGGSVANKSLKPPHWPPLFYKEQTFQRGFSQKKKKYSSYECQATADKTCIVYLNYCFHTLCKKDPADKGKIFDLE